jgi:hypothetical protein
MFLENSNRLKYVLFKYHMNNYEFLKFTPPKIPWDLKWDVLKK